jgi:hypothetical protein
MRCTHLHTFLGSLPEGLRRTTRGTKLTSSFSRSGLIHVICFDNVLKFAGDTYYCFCMPFKRRFTIFCSFSNERELLSFIDATSTAILCIAMVNKNRFVKLPQLCVLQVCCRSTHFVSLWCRRAVSIEGHQTLP